MTDKRSAMEIAIEHRPSLADAEVVQRYRNGNTRTCLRNTRTGEYFISFCSAHYDYDAECHTCHTGRWAYPA